MEVVASNVDEPLFLTAFLLLFAGIVLWTQISGAPNANEKGGRQVATSIFIMGSLAVFCLLWGKSLGRQMRCLPLK